MNERVELKYLLKPHQVPWILQHLGNRGASLLYEDRRINSIYFDNQSLEMHQETTEGITPRSKVRIRCYGEHSADCVAEHNLEIKTSGLYGRSKESTLEENWKDLLYKGIFFKHYGLIRPKVQVSYIRSYFLVDQVRITLDRELTYFPVTSSGFLAWQRRDDAIAFELKAPVDSDVNELMNTITLPRVQFSKFERAVAKLWNQEIAY